MATDPAAAAPSENLPVIQLFQESVKVTTQWGEDEIVILQPDRMLYSDPPYSFSAQCMPTGQFHSSRHLEASLVVTAVP